MCIRDRPDGEEGELIFTSLTKQASPVIRYRTRDITTLLPGTARTMRRMARVTGRSDDMLIIRGVNVYPSQIEAEILRVDGLSPHFLLEVSKDGNMASLKVRVEPQPGGAPADVGERLQGLIKSNVGVAADVEIAGVGELPRSQGKAQRVTHT